MNFEPVVPIELSTAHMNLDSNKTKGVGAGARRSSGTLVKRTEKSKQNVQLLKEKPHQSMSDSSLVTVPATSTSIQQVFSIPHTAPTLSQSSLGLSEKGVSCQSHPTVSTCCLVSPESFSSKVKVTGNGSCGDALATVGSVNNILQSLFS